MKPYQIYRISLKASSEHSTKNLTQIMLPNKSLPQKSTLQSLESRFKFRNEELGTEFRKKVELEETQKKAKTKITLKRRFIVEKIDGVVIATLSPNYASSSRHLQTTVILGLIPESNLLRKLGFQSQVSKFGFKIKDVQRRRELDGSLEQKQEQEQNS